MNKLLIIVTIILAAIVIGSFIFIRGKSPQRPTIPTPTPSPVTQTKPIPMNVFGVESISPKTDELLKIAHVTPITVTFNQIVDPKVFEFKTEPQTEVTAEFSGRNVTFKPKTQWMLDQEVTLTILTARSDKGIYMTNPYRITLKAPLPTF